MSLPLSRYNPFGYSNEGEEIKARLLVVVQRLTKMPNERAWPVQNRAVALLSHIDDGRIDRQGWTPGFLWELRRLVELALNEPERGQGKRQRISNKLRVELQALLLPLQLAAPDPTSPKPTKSSS